MWIGGGLGTSKKFLLDKEGEFNNACYFNMWEYLNIQICSAAAGSPWQNDICCQNHTVVDRCIEKILVD